MAPLSRSPLPTDGHCTPRGWVLPFGWGVQGPSGFNGHYLEAQPALYLLGHGARAYSPALSRFCSADPASPFAAGGVNAYAYCAAEPLNRTDPSGRAWLSALFSVERVLPKVTVKAKTVIKSVDTPIGIFPLPPVSANVLVRANGISADVVIDGLGFGRQTPGRMIGYRARPAASPALAVEGSAGSLEWATHGDFNARHASAMKVAEVRVQALGITQATTISMTPKAAAQATSAAGAPFLAIFALRRLRRALRR